MHAKHHVGLQLRVESQHVHMMKKEKKKNADLLKLKWQNSGCRALQIE